METAENVHLATPAEPADFSYSCGGFWRPLARADSDFFEGRVYFTQSRLIIRAVHPGRVIGWLERHLRFGNMIGGRMEIPIASIQTIEIEQHPLWPWLDSYMRVITTDIVVALWMGSGPLGCRFLQNRAAARAARFLHAVNPEIVVERG